jgi:hypothetical protein
MNVNLNESLNAAKPPNDPSSPTAELNAKPTPEAESAVGCSGLLGDVDEIDVNYTIPLSFHDEHLLDISVKGKLTLEWRKVSSPSLSLPESPKT